MLLHRGRHVYWSEDWVESLDWAVNYFDFSSIFQEKLAGE